MGALLGACVACQGGGSGGGEEVEASSRGRVGDKDAEGRAKKGKRGNKGGATSTGNDAKRSAEPEQPPPPPPELASWSKHFGSNHADGSNVGDGTVRAEEGTAVAVDAAGNVIVVGHFRGSADFGGGPLKVAGTVDVVVAKYDKSGAHQWSKRFGGSDDDQASDVAVDATGNVYVTGSFSGSIELGGETYQDRWGGFLLALDKSGNYVWSRHIAGGKGESVALSPDGDVVVGGIFWEKLALGGEEVKGAGRTNAFVARLDKSGTNKWLKTFGGSGGALTLGHAVGVHADGSAYLLATLDKTVDYGGGPLTSSGVSDVAVVKLDASGGHVWSKRFGGKATEYAHDLAVDTSGGVVFVGAFSQPVDFGGGELTSNGSGDAFVAKLDARGDHVWSKHFGGKQDDSADGVALDEEGNVAVTGYFSLKADFGGHPQEALGNRDAFIARLDPSGTPVWARRLGGSDNDYGRGVATDRNGAIVATGNFVGKATFTGGDITSNGGHDIYLLTFPNQPAERQ